MRVSHLGICVSDVEASLRFYRDGLGFSVVDELGVAGEPSETLLRLRDVSLRAIYLHRDELTIELLHYASPGHVGDGAPRAMNALGLTHLSFRVDDLGAALTSLADAGATVLRDTQIHDERLGARAAFVSDPDGTLVELVESARG